MPKIKLMEAKTNEGLPAADGYLIQYKFKNGFKDFRLGDCMFAKDLASLGQIVKSREDLTSYAFLIEEEGKKVSKELMAVADSLIKQGYDAVLSDDGESYDVYLARNVKVWPLTDGKPVPAGSSYYIMLDGKVLTPAEFNKVKNDVIEKTKAMLPKTASLF